VSDVVDAYEEDMVPLGDMLAAADQERVRLERRAKRAASRSVAALGGVTRLHATGGSTAWRDWLAVDNKGKPRGTAGNVLQVLQHDEGFTGCLAKDVFKGVYLWLKKPPFQLAGPFPREVKDADIVVLCRWLEQAHEVFAGLQTVAQVMGAIADHLEVDQLRAWLDSLKWDGRPRIGDWLVRLCGVADSVYARAVGRRTLLALAARGLMPGCKADTMLVLEGPQGRRKSTVLRALAGDDWYTDSVPIHVEDKDAVLALGGKWVIEFGELDRFRRTDRSALKDFMSRLYDRIRLPFGRTPVTMARRCVFFGTTNEAAYLDDATGARRFWPVLVEGEIKVEALRRWREQLFAEAVAAIRGWELVRHNPQHPDHIAGQWWLTPDEEDAQRLEADTRQILDPWEARLAGWAETQTYLTSTEAFRQLGLDIHRATKGDQMRLGDVFRRLGFGERTLTRVGTGREWRFVKRVVTTVTTSPEQVVTEKVNDSKVVTTVTTVTTIPTHTHARARPSDTGGVGDDSGDMPEKAQEKRHHLPSVGGDNPARGGDSLDEADIDDMWGGP